MRCSHNFCGMFLFVEECIVMRADSSGQKRVLRACVKMAAMKNRKAQGKHGKFYVFKWIIISLRTHFYKKSNCFSSVISHGIMIFCLNDHHSILKRLLNRFCHSLLSASFFEWKYFGYQVFNVFGRHGFMFLNG